MLVFGLLTGWVRRRQLAQLARQHWRGILLAETVFLLAFLAAFAVRLANPDLWHPFRGGEKPMEFAYLNAIIRSTTLPPFDPWFAGGYINYYYYGHFIVANLTKLTGIMPEVAFNLAVPTFFSLSVAAVGSLTYNVAEAARGRLGWRPGFRRIAHWPSLATAGLAIFLTLLAGNVVSALQAFSRVAGASAWDITTPVIGPLVNLAGGAVTIVIGQAPFDYDFWAPSRAINRNAFEVGQVGPITEFPFFTFPVRRSPSPHDRDPHFAHVAGRRIRGASPSGRLAAPFNRTAHRLRVGLNCADGPASRNSPLDECLGSGNLHVSGDRHARNRRMERRAKNFSGHDRPLDSEGAVSVRRVEHSVLARGG